MAALGACRSEHARGGSTSTTAIVAPTPAPMPGPTTTVPAAPATTVATSTSATTAAAPTCPSGTGAAAQSAPQAARCLYEAWKANDRTGAAVFASLDVVDVVFQRSWSPPAGTFTGCSAEAGNGVQACRFLYHGGSYRFDAQPSEGGWRVTAIQAPAAP